MECQSKIVDVIDEKISSLVACSTKWNKIATPDQIKDFELLIDEDLINHADDPEYVEKYTGKYASNTRWRNTFNS